MLAVCARCKVASFIKKTWPSATKRCVKFSCELPFERNLHLSNVRNGLTQMTTRTLQTSCVKFLELVNSKTHEDWENQFWDKVTEERKTRRVGITYSTVRYLQSLRGFNLFLLKPGSDFKLSEEFYTMCEDVKSNSDIVANNFPLREDNIKIPIENRYLSLDEWQSVLDKMCSETLSKNVAFTCLMEFAILKNATSVKVDKSIDINEQICGPLANSFLDYMFSTQENIDQCQRSLAIYLGVCANLEFSEKFEKTYGMAKDNIKVFGLDLMYVCLKNLRGTKYWRDVYEYQRILSDFTGRSDLNELTVTALSNGDLETGLKAFGDIFKPDPEKKFNQPTVKDYTIVSMLETFRYDEDPAIWKRNREIIEVMFTMLNYSLIYPTSQGTAQAIADWFTAIENEKWEYVFAENREIRYLQCPFTGVTLDKNELTDEEYVHLAEMVFSHIVKQEMSKPDYISATYKLKNPTYIGTRRAEIKSFMTMLYQKGPFDLVVDGLNVLYYVKKRLSTGQNLMHMCNLFIRSVIKSRETRQGRKLNTLIIFRRHVQRFIRNEFQNVATIWYSSDDSRDDPFFLYAAILSGKQCDLMTLDLMRNIKHLLSKIDYKDACLLYKWQQIHQDSYHMTQGKVIRQGFDTSIQRTENTWHFPYACSGHHFPLRGPTTDWLCLQRVDR